MSKFKGDFWLTVLAVWLVTDLWRLFTPSLITLFGRAAETPAEVMGLYALGVMASPLVLLAFIKRPAPRLAAVLLAAAFVLRIVLQLNPSGGDLQLYGSSVAVALAVAALCLSTGFTGRQLIPTSLLGLAIATTVHALLGSFGAVWRSDLWAYGVLLTEGLLLALVLSIVFTQQQQQEQSEASNWRTSLLLFPMLLLLQLALSNVGRGSTVADLTGQVAVVVGIWLGVWVATAAPATSRPLLSAAVLIALVFVSMMPEVTRDNVAGQLSMWSLAAFVLGPAALARVMTYVVDAGKPKPATPRKSALLTAAGAVIWTIFLFLFYAGYDMGYRADGAIVALAALVVIVALTARPATHSTAANSTPILSTKTIAIAAAASVIAAFLGPLASIRPLDGAPVSAAADGGDVTYDPDRQLTVVAYNLRMGYGIDGTFDQVAVAQQILDSDAQVVMLSEVDRGWLLNGGQDQLAILSRLTNMPFVFGPAGDQVWGDVIMSSLPLKSVSAEKMPAFDSLTGAAMTIATVSWRGTNVQLISTHLQPDYDDNTLRQAQYFADAIKAAAVNGPVIAGGDLNTEPDTPAWQALLSSGAADALAAIRPAPTWSAENPSQQIDHLFVSGFEVADAGVVQSLLSDHLMVQVAFE